jgi:transcriptional regulator with XRE-family HTH domain
MRYHVGMDGTELRAWRKKRDWTQRQLADKLGVNRVTVADWERNASGKKMLESQVLARALKQIECEEEEREAVDATDTGL